MRLAGHVGAVQSELMPTLLHIDGYRFFFFSNERQEPPHVHVRRGAAIAKFWLQPLRLAHASGFTPAELRRMRELVFEHQAQFVEKWHEHFAS
jgi:hypothetical protein